MRRAKSPRSANALVFLVTLVTLIFGTAGPAAAQQVAVGAGAGLGWEYASTETLCGTTGTPLDIPFGASYEDDLFVLPYTESTFAATNVLGATIASYIGPVTITITTEDNVQAPQGAAPGDCTGLPVVPLPVPLSGVTVDGSAGTGSVHCDGFSADPLTNVYERATLAIVFTFDLVCDVKGNVTPLVAQVNDVPTRFVIEGTQVACFPLTDPCDETDPNASSVLVTAFEAAGAP